MFRTSRSHGLALIAGPCTFEGTRVLSHVRTLSYAGGHLGHYRENY